ncbi:MAG TPA: hypothetical protein VFA94_03500 [Acidimicrobiales bacterium]|nr:hypothetical protein [Acidimicrobiales bacterium]
MRVMVIESEHGAADRAVSQLHAAGHWVYRCHNPELPDFPCNGHRDQTTCPLAHDPDIVLIVRRHASSRPAPLEDGVACALRQGIPIVAIGTAALNPYERWGVRWAGDRGTNAADVVTAAFGTSRDEPSVKDR